MSITKTVFTDNEARMGDPNTENYELRIIGGEVEMDFSVPNVALGAAISCNLAYHGGARW
jgi:hypothetical protein